MIGAIPASRFLNKYMTMIFCCPPNFLSKWIMPAQYGSKIKMGFYCSGSTTIGVGVSFRNFKSKWDFVLRPAKKMLALVLAALQGVIGRATGG